MRPFRSSCPAVSARPLVSSHPFASACLALAITAALPLPVFAGHTTVDKALHCAALAQITIDILTADGGLTPDDREAVTLSIQLMLARSTLPEAKREKAMQTHVADLKSAHTAAQIADEIGLTSDACVRKYVN